jgi:hypothetical protein
MGNTERAARKSKENKRMEREPVKSSQLKSVGFDAESGILEVEFNGGGIYRYLSVTKETHQGLMEAQSIGKYFGQQVRGKFKFEKQEPEKSERVTA